MRLKIKEDPSFEKDNHNKAILNVDMDALSAYKKQRKIITAATTATKEIEVIKKDIDEIKSLLHQLINNK